MAEGFTPGTVAVRRSNGQNEYGPWLAVNADEVPGWVGEMIADEVAESKAESGEVERGGSRWIWRK